MSGGFGDEAERKYRRVNLNELYALDAILHARSLSEAGKSISVSQPAMSMALGKLRNHFDDELVIYSRRGPQLTELAQELRARTSRLLYEVDDAFHLRLAFDPATTTRTISITAPETIEIMLLSHLAPALLRKAPGIRIEFLPFDYSSPERMFDRGADMALVPERLASRELATKPMFDQGIVAIMCADHPLGRRRSLSREEYALARHAALAESAERHEFGALTAEPLFASRRVVVRTGLYSALPGLVIGTDLIATTTNWLAQFHAAILPLQLVNLPFDTPLLPIVAQWLPHRSREPVIQWLLDRLIEVLVRQGPANNRWHQSG